MKNPTRRGSRGIEAIFPEGLERQGVDEDQLCGGGERTLDQRGDEAPRSFGHPAIDPQRGVLPRKVDLLHGRVVEVTQVAAIRRLDRDPVLQEERVPLLYYALKNTNKEKVAKNWQHFCRICKCYKNLKF